MVIKGRNAEARMINYMVQDCVFFTGDVWEARPTNATFGSRTFCSNRNGIELKLQHLLTGWNVCFIFEQFADLFNNCIVYGWFFGKFKKYKYLNCLVSVVLISYQQLTIWKKFSLFYEYNKSYVHWLTHLIPDESFDLNTLKPTLWL